MYGGESWTIKKAEHQRIDHFKLRCWKRRFRNLGLQGDQISLQSYRKSTLNSHWKDWCWSWSSNTLATWCKELTHWKRPWCWERLKVKGEGGHRGWDGQIASLTQWAWIWTSITESMDMNLSKNSGRKWRTEEPGVLQSMGLLGVCYKLVTEQEQQQSLRA